MQSYQKSFRGWNSHTGICLTTGGWIQQNRHHSSFSTFFVGGNKATKWRGRGRGREEWAGMGRWLWCAIVTVDFIISLLHTGTRGNQVRSLRGWGYRVLARAVLETNRQLLYVYFGKYLLADILYCILQASDGKMNTGNKRHISIFSRFHSRHFWGLECFIRHVYICDLV